MISITDRAAAKARALHEAEGHSETDALRVGVQGGGCSGFQYVLEFDEARDDDLRIPLDGLLVVVDPFSARLLDGSELDYDNSLGGKGFDFVNPHVEGGCGCGKSFQVNPDALAALEL